MYKRRWYHGDKPSSYWTEVFCFFNETEDLKGNHPGVMYHVTGLFSRRAFNLEGILCGQLGDGRTSQIYLLVKAGQQLDQVVKQLNKLHDVLTVSLLEDCECSLFTRIHEMINTRPVTDPLSAGGAGG